MPEAEDLWNHITTRESIWHKFPEDSDSELVECEDN